MHSILQLTQTSNSKERNIISKTLNLCQDGGAYVLENEYQNHIAACIDKDEVSKLIYL